MRLSERQIYILMFLAALCVIVWGVFVLAWAMDTSSARLDVLYAEATERALNRD